MDRSRIAGSRPARRILWAAVAVVTAVGDARSARAAGVDDPAHWSDGYRALADLGDGYVVWESNRSGPYRLYTCRLDGAGLRQLTPDEPARDHYCPHISPDGSRIAYLSYPRDMNTYGKNPREARCPLRLIQSDGSADRVIVESARAYGEDRAVVWVDDGRLVYIGPDERTYLLTLSTGCSEALVAAAPASEKWTQGWLIDPTLRHATTGRPTFSVYDRASRKVELCGSNGGCQPYFTADGRWGFWMGGAGGPINRIDLATRTVSPIIGKDDPSMPPGRAYLYFPMVSRNRRLLAFGASPNQHDHFKSDYDIFVAPIDPRTLAMTGRPVRYSFDKGCDRFPDVFLAPPAVGEADGEAPFTVQPTHTAIESAPAAGDDSDGVTERARRPNPMLTAGVAVESLSWPVRREGLVFAWEGCDKPNRVADGYGWRACSVAPRGKARFDRAGAMVIREGAMVAEGADALLLEACRTSNQLTIETRFTAAGTTASGPARIVSFSTDPGCRNFTLGQERDRLILRLRTPVTGQNGTNPEVNLGPVASGKPVHVVVTYRPGDLRVYRDGVRADLGTQRLSGDFSNWSPQRLIFGNECTSDRPWSGVISHAAIYSRFIEEDEAAASCRALVELDAARPAVAGVKVLAELVEASPAPSLQQIAPYREALAVNLYRIRRVLAGEAALPPRVRVAQWVILDGRSVFDPPAAGRAVELDLEELAANTQLRHIYRADSLDIDPEATVYFDTTHP